MFTYSLVLTILVVNNVVLGTSKIIKNSIEIQLWHGEPPDGPGPKEPEKVSSTGAYSNISRPRLIVHIPEHSIGSAMLVISGGGYSQIEMAKESTPAATWLQSIGVTSFELIYRLPAEGWSSRNVPFEDGQRAMRLIRGLAKKYSFNENKIGIMGFSAGGHLAGVIETKYDKKLYTPTDSFDRLSAKPYFAALLYPIISMLPPFNNTISEKKLLGEHPTTKLQKEYSVYLHVNAQTAPSFLAHAQDDPISNVENSKLMYAALQKHNVTSELHLFETGGHGWGLGKPGSPEQVWPELFRKWALSKSYFNEN